MNPSQNPAGLTGIVASALVIILGFIGVDITTEEGVVLVGALVAIVSYFNPKESEV